jgi:hypothetical protein
MLKKLIKHEYKAVWKFLAIAAAFMVIMTIVGAAGIYILTPEATVYSDYVRDYNDNVSGGAATATFDFSSLLAGLYVMAYVAAVFLLTAGTYIYLWMRFDKSMYGHQGYLTNTLPATPAKLILAKLITAVSWVCLSITLLIGSVFALLAAIRAASGSELTNNVPDLFADLKQAGVSVPGMIILFVLLVFAAIIMSVLMMYGASALGQLAKKSRVIATIAFYYAMTMVINFVGTFIMSATFRSFTQKASAHFGGSGLYLDNHNYIEQIGLVYRSVSWTALIFLILIIAGSIALYFLTHHVTSKRLNLE